MYCNPNTAYAATARAIPIENIQFMLASFEAATLHLAGSLTRQR